VSFAFVNKGSQGAVASASALPLSYTPANAGSLLVAMVEQLSSAGFTGPGGGWQRAGQSTVASVCGIELWYLQNNPGTAISGLNWTGASGVAKRGQIAEFTTSAGGNGAAVYGTPGTNSTSTAGTTLSVTSGASTDGNLVIPLYQASFSSAPAGDSWTTPTSYTLIGTQNAVTNEYAWYYRIAPPTGTQSVTGTKSTSTNMTGFAGLIVVFAENPSSSDTGAGLDAGESIQATLSSADTGTGTDARETITLTSADTGSGSDTGSVGIPVSDTDAGTGTDAVASVQVADAELGTGADTQVSPLHDQETGTFTESASQVETITVSSADSGSGADAGSVAVAAAISSTDSGSFTETQVVHGAPAGAGPGFPLIFNMAAVPTTSPTADVGSFTEAQSVTALVRDTDTGHFTEHQNSPGGFRPPPALPFEGFSVTHVGVLVPGTPAELGTLYGVQSATLTPQWITTPTSVDDQVSMVWNAPGKLTLAVQGGFLPWDVVAALTGNEVYSSGAAPADYYALPFATQHNTSPFSLVIRMAARDDSGNPRTQDVVVYAAQFGTPSFTGPAYKNGLVASYTAAVVLSPVDETGGLLPDLAFGRISSLPPGAPDWGPPLPPVVPNVQVTDTDAGTFVDGGERVAHGGAVFVSDTDAASFAETGSASTSGGGGGGTGVVFGATVNLAAGTYPSCSGGPVDLCSAAAFDLFVSTGLSAPIKPAELLQKVYHEANHPMVVQASWVAFVRQGGKLLISVKAPQTFTAANDTAFTAFIRACISQLGLGNFKIVLWQECNRSGGFTPSTYQAYWSHYYRLAKAVSRSVVLVYNPALGGASDAANAASCVSFFPDGDLTTIPDEFYLDFYASAFLHNSRLDSADATGADIQALADFYGIPLGFGEWALSASSGTVIAVSDWETFVSYVIRFFQARANAGKPNGWMVYFGSNGNGGLGQNGFASSSDPGIPGFQRLVLALAAGQSLALSSSESGTFTEAQTVTTGGKAARYVGAIVAPLNACPNSVSAWGGIGQATFSNDLAAVKLLYASNAAMTTWAAGSESGLPSSALAVICFKDSHISSLASYIASIPARTAEVWLAYFNEPEAAYPNGNYTQFLATFKQCSQIIRAAGNPLVKVAQVSQTYQYGVAGSLAQQGVWRAPASEVDYYCADVYQHFSQGWPSQGLSNYNRWTKWLSVFSGRGVPLAITEYGIDGCGGSAVRNSRIQADCAYLRTAFGTGGTVSVKPLGAWIYSWTNCNSGVLATSCFGSCQFTDTATVTTWTQVCTGAL
jgi:hypothetical protein